MKIALIDRGVVVLTDMANNATPLSDRFRKRFQNRAGTLAGMNEEKSAEDVVGEAVDAGNGELTEEMNDACYEERTEKQYEGLSESGKEIDEGEQEPHLEEASRSFVTSPAPPEKVSLEVR